MGTHERFKLRWEGFEANIKVALKDVRNESEFSDVTLVAGDGKQVKANKVILAGGSSFFFNILRENPHPHPLIYMKGVGHDQLLSLLDFLYTGEAIIVEEDLKTFMDIAEDLKVKGLTPPGSQTKANPSTSVPLQIQEAAEEPGPSARASYPHGTTSPAPASLQNHVAAKPMTSSSVSHPHHDTTAFFQGQSTVKESVTSPKISRPLNGISALQGLVPSPKASRPPGMAASDRDNVKVEVGDAEDYNVSYGLNDHDEPFIKHVSIRGLNDNEGNIGCKDNISNVEVSGGNFVNTQRIGDFYEQNEECQSEGMWLSEKQEKNNHVCSTGQKPKQDIMYSSTGLIISEVANNEHLNNDWYEQGEENNRLMQAEMEEDDYFELDKKDNSLSNFDGKQEVVDTNCDMDVTEVADNVFVNEQSTHAFDERSEEIYGGMIPDGEQDIKRKKRSHNGEKRFQCLICSKTFSRLDHLKRHKIVHTGEKSYQCAFCFKRFSRKDYLNQHTRIHSGEKPYQCLQCYKKFAQKTLLNAHMAIHIYEQSYQ